MPLNKPRKALPQVWFQFWPLVALIGISVILIYATIAGWTLLQIGNTFSFTVYAFILLSRRVVQQKYALSHNGSMMEIVRTPLIEELRRRLPEAGAWLDEIEFKHMPFDSFKEQIQTHLELSDLTWKDVVQSSFRSFRKVTIQAPIYKLKQTEVEALVRSVISQTYPVFKCYLVVNNPRAWKGQEMIDFLSELITREEVRNSGTRFEIVVAEKKGKREAMYIGFLRGIRDRADYIINVDGDTYLHHDAIANAVRVFEARPNVSALTGDIRVSNREANLLTRLTSLRYFYAFNVERAAQSAVGQMTCLSGPFLAVRREVLQQILRDWYNQEFLGVKCTYGDDRHLTTLILLLGGVAIFVPDAIAWTDAPTSLRVWIKQQLRWSESGHRENWWLVSRKRQKPIHWFIWLDLLYLSLFPFLVLGALGAVLIKASIAAYTISMMAGLMMLAPYLIAVLVMNLAFNSLYGLYLMRDWHYLLSPLYVFLYFGFLVWLKLWAIVKLRDAEWGTK